MIMTVLTKLYKCLYLLGYPTSSILLWDATKYTNDV